MKTITLDRYTSILKGPHVKFNEFLICILSRTLRLHICIFLFKDVWLSSTELSISDCELFLGYLANLSFKYIPTTGHREQLQYSPSPQKMSQVLDDVEGEGTITAEKEDDTVVGSTGKRLQFSTHAVSTAEKDVVNESDGNAET